MTREEAIKILYKVKTSGEENHALVMAINALEQEAVLGKIRAEIESKCDRINSLASVLPYKAHREIQELLCEIIMDLCKAESEDKE